MVETLIVCQLVLTALIGALNVFTYLKLRSMWEIQTGQVQVQYKSSELLVALVKAEAERVKVFQKAANAIVEAAQANMTPTGTPEDTGSVH